MVKSVDAITVSPSLDVVCGVIRRNETCLLALRHAHQDQGGLWEFPGGKINQGETIAAALRRELREEIAIDVIDASPWLQVDHQYSDYAVRLHVWNVNQYHGEPVGAEGQSIQWVLLQQMPALAIPAANQAIVEHLLAGTKRSTFPSIAE